MMRKFAKKGIVVLLTLMIIMVSFSAGDAKSQKVKIGWSWFGLSYDYFVWMRTEVHNYIKEKGLQDKIDLIELDGQNDTNKQNGQIDNLIAQKVNVIVMAPMDRNGSIPAVKAAKKAGIPLIELCSSTAATDIRTSYVGSDDVVSGRLLMQELARRSGGKGNVLVLDGPAGQNAQIMRLKGCKEVLTKYPDIKIAAEKVCNWSRAEAMAAVENYLQTDIKIDMIFAENDEMAMGALMATEASPKGKGILIGGVDAIADSLKAIGEGRLACTVFQNGREQGRTALEVAYQAGRGKKIKNLYDIPYELVTKENAEKYKH
jgi:inositol transport system substrate-binding protein